MFEWIKNNKKHLIILFYFLIFSGFIGIFFVQAPNYDFYSYHFHNGWAFLNDRINIDFMPAIFRTYFNPILDVINYLLITKLQAHPCIFLFLSSLKFGIFLFMTYLIADLAFIDKNNKNTGIVTSLILTTLSPIVLFAIRFDNNDLVCANLTMISLYIFLKFIFAKELHHRLLALFFSALILSAGIGLKYTSGSYAIPMIVSCIVFYKKIPQLFKTFLTMLSGGIFGFLITDGWWMYLLWKHFRNPLFPYLNNFFKSPLADANSVISADFAHLKYHNPFDFILSPLITSYKHKYAGIEVKYYDPKLAISFVIYIISGVLLSIKSFREKLETIIRFDVFIILVLFIILPYYINLAIFGVIRYIVMTFALTSIVLTAIAMIIKIKLKKTNFYPLMVIILILNIFFAKYINSDFITPEGNIITIENKHIENNSTVLAAGALSSFVIPAQNSKAQYTAFTFPKKLEKDFKKAYKKYPPFRNHFYYSKLLEEKNEKAFKNAENLYLIINQSDYLMMPKSYDKAIKIYSEGKIKNLKTCETINYKLFNSYTAYKYKICKIK